MATVNKESGIPYSPEMEVSVLGSVLLEGSSVMAIVAHILEPSDFWKPQHRYVWIAMLDLYQRQESIDMMTVAETLKASARLDSVGGTDYLAEVMDSVATTANVKIHTRYIKNRSAQRQLLSFANKLISNVDKPIEDETLDIIIGKCSRVLLGINERRQEKKTSGLTHIKPAIMALTNDLEKRSIRSNNYIPIGYPEIDRKFGGLRKRGYNVLAGRPGMGKTSFALNIIDNLISGRNMSPDLFDGKPPEKLRVALFSLEMSTSDLLERMVSANAKIDASKMQRGALSSNDWTKLMPAAGKLYEAELYIDDTSGITPFDIALKLQTLITEAGPVDLVVIDYLQLMSPDRREQNRDVEIGSMTRALKNLARDVNTTILLLCQLSREVDKRPNKRPMLSDLRESGNIEQDAETVIFLYRAGYYKNESSGKTEVIYSKNRHGAVGFHDLMFLGEYTRFQ